MASLPGVFSALGRYLFSGKDILMLLNKEEIMTHSCSLSQLYISENRRRISENALFLLPLMKMSNVLLLLQLIFGLRNVRFIFSCYFFRIA